MRLPTSLLPACGVPASLRGSARALALLLALHAAAFVEVPLWNGLGFAGISAHADDGDGGDGDGGGDGGGGGGAGGGDGGGGGGEAAADYEPLEDPLPIAGETFIADELLLLAPSQAALNRATALGLRVIERVQTRQLGVSFARLRLPPGLDARSAREILSERGPGEFDLHHLYKIAQAAPAARCEGPGCAARELIGWPTDSRACGRGQAIGIVDTAVDAAHPALVGADLRRQAFVTAGKEAAPADHGTAVAALLVGQPDSVVPGLVPRARVFAAAPFHTLPSGNATADTAGLVKSLDWLVGQGVAVIGMSLAGPDNAVLREAVRRVAARGIVVVAAAGNGGRNAPPAYPAAHERVLGVTAVSADRRVYWRANQGDYIDYALPGVNVWTADPAGGGRARSGTSYAVPYMVALASQTLAQRVASRDVLLDGRLGELADLGDPGRDPVFGYGKPRFDRDCR
jgi:minor extracellular protease Epr